MTSPEGTSISTPPEALFDRQPPITSVVPKAVTSRGEPSSIASPFKWQRSDGSSLEINGGRHLGAKLDDGSIVAKHEKRVLTNQSSFPRP